MTRLRLILHLHEERERSLEVLEISIIFFTGDVELKLIPSICDSKSIGFSFVKIGELGALNDILRDDKISS